VHVANGFVGERENRKQLFGEFTENNVPDKVTLLSESTQTDS